MVALKSLLLVASTALLSLTQAVPVFTSGDKNVESIASALICPKGQVLFKGHNEGIVPHTTPSAVWKHIGDFSDVEWQGFTLSYVPLLSHLAIIYSLLTSCLLQSTTGRPNSPGSTRTFSTLGLTLTEKLNINIGSSSGSTPLLPLFYQQFSLVGTYEIYSTKVSGVQDFLSATKTADGSTKITWEVIGCTTGVETARAVFEQVHGGAIDGTIARFSS